jgi:hypothetical protein
MNFLKTIVLIKSTDFLTEILAIQILWILFETGGFLLILNLNLYLGQLYLKYVYGVTIMKK